MKKWNIGWGVVSLCNMECQFCYSRSKRNKEYDIAPDYCKQFVDNNANKIASINYGTGENALSQEWFELIDYIRTNYPEIRQAVTTNGYISEEIRYNERNRCIFMKSIDEVDVSLDFADETQHNKFRGQKMAYRWAIETMRICQKNDIRLTVVTLGSDKVLYEENVKGIFEIAKKYDSLVRVNIYRPTNGINEFTKQFLLSKERLIDFLLFVNTNYQILALDDALLSSILLNKESPDSSGLNSIRILPNGDITPSTYLIQDKYIFGNLKDAIDLASLEELNDNRLKNIICDILPKECENCTFSKICKGGVIDRRYLWNGTLQKRDPYCFVEEPILMQRIKDRIAISGVEFQSVHNGYLPTMFFKN